MKDCCQVTAPGLLFIAEAIVAPLEIIKYFGEDAIIAKECEIAYIESNDETAIERAVGVILLLHGMILSYGGIPLLYYGDEVGTLNDSSFMQDNSKAGDNRWIHRPRIDWDKLRDLEKIKLHALLVFLAVVSVVIPVT